MMTDNRTWPWGLCVVCRNRPAEPTVTINELAGLMVACKECWSKLTLAEKLDYVGQIQLGYLGSDPHPQEYRLAAITAVIREARCDVIRPLLS